jgi:hypothetical protein
VVEVWEKAGSETKTRSEAADAMNLVKRIFVKASDENE